jgi:hypothetical protein
LQDGHLHEIHKAVRDEVKIFKRREDILGLFKVKYCSEEKTHLEKVPNVSIQSFWERAMSYFVS